MNRYRKQIESLSAEQLVDELVKEHTLKEEAELCLRHLGHPDWRRTAWPQVRLRHFHGEFQPKN